MMETKKTNKKMVSEFTNTSSCGKVKKQTLLEIYCR